MAFENKLTIRNAIYAVFPSQSLELSFLHLFSGLESLVLDFRRRKDFEYILPKKKFSILRKSIKNFIKEESVNLNLVEDEITSISNKLSELNRVSLKEAFEYFCKKYKLDISDL